jgi:DNA polymerase-3 subunit chi
LAIKGLPVMGASRRMVEIFFYHHQNTPIGETLPRLLEKSLARGWRVVVQATSEARLRALDQALWAGARESFLPHGTIADPSPETQPIYLTASNDNPNRAEVRFFLEGARVADLLSGDVAPRERAVLLFDGEEEAELEDARAQWRELRDAGHELVYLQQEGGAWVEKARARREST